MKIRRLLIFVILAFIFNNGITAQVQTEKVESEINILEFPEQTGSVNDFENIFTDKQITQLTKLLTYYKENSNREIVVITIDSIPVNEQFDQFSIKMSEAWGVGKENDGNGLTIVLSIALRKIRISTTDKTRYALPDEFCLEVINEYIIPEFKKKEYYKGLLSGINELIREWR